jgi:hypothetical protein
MDMFKKMVLLLGMVVLLSGCSDNTFDVVGNGKVVEMESVTSSKTDTPLVLYKIKKVAKKGKNISFIGEGVIMLKSYMTLYAPRGFAEMGDILGYTNGVYGVIGHE